MKLGDIKLQALSLIFPDGAFEYACKDMESLIFNLKSGSGYASYLVATVGAINRAFTIIEQRGLLNKSSFALKSEYGNKIGDFCYFDLNAKKEIFSIDRVFCDFNGKRQSLFYEMQNNMLAVKTASAQGEIGIVYREKIKRIDFLTSDNEEINLPYAIEEMIPYFVKADLLFGERPEQARAARELFDKALDECQAVCEENAEIETVYSMGGI